MKSHFSFGLSVLPVEVNKRDINDGVSRSCRSCAIARALNRTLPRYGFIGCHVRLVPYASFADADGLEIYKDYQSMPIARLDVRDLPAGLIEWAMDFDDWSEFMHEYGGSRRAWKEATGSDYYPFPPEPISFIFNFGRIQPFVC